MIIAIVVLQLILCFFISVLMAVGNPGQAAIIPLQVWLVGAVLQLAVHYLPRRPYIRTALVSTLALMLLAGVGLEGRTPIPFLEQTLFISAIAVTPQLWCEWFSKTKTGLGPIVLFSLTLGVIVWSFANIAIVEAKARSVARGEPYCLFLSDNGLSYGAGYHKAPNLWSLTGWSMFAVRGIGGSGNCCQWNFHALLVTKDYQLFNWSYAAQRFETISEQTRRTMGLNMSC